LFTNTKQTKFAFSLEENAILNVKLYVILLI